MNFSWKNKWRVYSWLYNTSIFTRLLTTNEEPGFSKWCKLKDMDNAIYNSHSYHCIMRKILLWCDQHLEKLRISKIFYTDIKPMSKISKNRHQKDMVITVTGITQIGPFPC